MPLLRWLPVCLGLVSFSATTCRKSDPAETKPVATPEVSIPGVDTSSLTPRERRDWASQVSELLAPCPDTPVSIAQCVKDQKSCKSCLPAAQFLLKQVQAGKPKKEREDAFHARFDAGKTKTISTEGSPEMGAPDAVVTIVEWADFECPFCMVMSPLLDDIVQRFPTQAKLVFKFYPLEAHPHGEIAARAAIAAMNQGKFWEMHHLLFENQKKLEQSDLERYAKELKLDMAKFRADLAAKETGERIERDKKQGNEVGLEGTPTIYINGRELNLKDLTNPVDDLEEWIKVEIELMGKTPKFVPRPAGSASAMPPGTAAPTTSASAGVGKEPAEPGKKPQGEGSK